MGDLLCEYPYETYAELLPSGEWRIVCNVNVEQQQISYTCEQSDSFSKSTSMSNSESASNSRSESISNSKSESDSASISNSASESYSISPSQSFNECRNAFMPWSESLKRCVCAGDLSFDSTRTVDLTLFGDPNLPKRLDYDTNLPVRVAWDDSRNFVTIPYHKTSRNMFRQYTLNGNISSHADYYYHGEPDHGHCSVTFDGGQVEDAVYHQINKVQFYNINSDTSNVQRTTSYTLSCANEGYSSINVVSNDTKYLLAAEGRSTVFGPVVACKVSDLGALEALDHSKCEVLEKSSEFVPPSQDPFQTGALLGVSKHILNNLDLQPASTIRNEGTVTIEKANGSIVSGNENGNNLEQSLYVSMVLDKSTFNDAFGGVAWPFSSTTERAIMLGSISYNQTPGIQDPEGSHYVEVGDIIKFDGKFVKGRLRHDFETSANYISTLEPLNEIVQVVLSTPSHIWTVAKSGNIYRTEIENVGQNTSLDLYAMGPTSIKCACVDSNWQHIYVCATSDIYRYSIPFKNYLSPEYNDSDSNTAYDEPLVIRLHQYSRNGYAPENFLYDIGDNLADNRQEEFILPTVGSMQVTNTNLLLVSLWPSYSKNQDDNAGGTKQEVDLYSIKEDYDYNHEGKLFQQIFMFDISCIDILAQRYYEKSLGYPETYSDYLTMLALGFEEPNDEWTALNAFYYNVDYTHFYSDNTHYDYGTLLTERCSSATQNSSCAFRYVDLFPNLTIDMSEFGSIFELSLSPSNEFLLVTYCDVHSRWFSGDVTYSQQRYSAQQTIELVSDGVSSPYFMTNNPLPGEGFSRTSTIQDVYGQTYVLLEYLPTETENIVCEQTTTFLEDSRTFRLWVKENPWNFYGDNGYKYVYMKEDMTDPTYVDRFQDAVVDSNNHLDLVARYDLLQSDPENSFSWRLFRVNDSINQVNYPTSYETGDVGTHNLYSENTDNAETIVAFDASSNTISISSNQMPNHATENDVYVTDPVAVDLGCEPVSTSCPGSPATEIQIPLIGGRTDLDTIEDFQDISVHNPSFGDVGYIGRPHVNLPQFTHWSALFNPIEIIRLDPMPAEAWDQSPGAAVGNYNGYFRFNLYSLVVNASDPEFINLEYLDGTSVLERLANDSYYAHTQPLDHTNIQGGGGVYHYHGWKAGEVLNYANKVIGYSVDGFAIMGHNTYIFKPIFTNDRVTGYDDATEHMKPGVSGYHLRADFVSNREAFDDTTAVPLTAPGCFHVDYEYSNSTSPENQYLLDAYNMGYTALKHADDDDYTIEKVYVCTMDYPYTLHTTYFNRQAYGGGGGGGGSGRGRGSALGHNHSINRRSLGRGRGRGKPRWWR